MLAMTTRWRQLIVSSDDPAAEEQVAEAIARVLSRYAVAYTSAVEVTIPNDGVDVTYVAKAAINRVSTVRGARTAGRASTNA